MNVMWLTAMPAFNIVNDQGISTSGGWIGAMLDLLKEQDVITKIKIVSICSAKEFRRTSGKIEVVQINTKNITKGYSKYDIDKLKLEIDEFLPSIIDVQGSEFYLANILKDTFYKGPVVITLQGLISDIWKKFTVGIPFYVAIKFISLKDLLFNDNLFSKQIGYKRRGENELLILKHFNNFLGRTEWDKLHSHAINNNSQYFHCDRVLRNLFYENEWSIAECNKYTLFTTQAHYPIKGLHILLESLALIKTKFKNVKLYIAGKSIINVTIYQRLKQ